MPSTTSRIDSIREDQKIKSWQREVAKSTADDVTSITRNRDPAQVDPSPLVVNNHIVTTNPPIVITRIKAPEPETSDEISTKAIIGTVAGATAGAFIAYAMVKGSSENHKPINVQKPITYRTIEAPIYDESHGRYILNDAPPRLQARSYGPTLVSKGSHESHYSVASRNGPIVMIDNERALPSHASSGSRTVRQAEIVKTSSLPPPPGTKLSREAPLPTPSQYFRGSRAADSKIRQQTTTMPALQSHAPSVTPNDSISQVSSRKSSESERARRRHTSQHGGSKAGTKSVKRHEGSKASKAESKQQHGVGAMVEDVVSMIKGTSIKSRS